MIYARFSHPDWGYSYDQEQCQANGLIEGKSYEMAFIKVGRSSSQVFS